MGRADILRPYVEKTLMEFFNTTDLVVDPDGDWPVRHGSAIYFIRLLDSEPPVIHVFSPMLKGIRKSNKVFQTLNDLNARAPFVKFFVVEDKIFVATDLLAETLDKEELANAIMTVATAADYFDTELQKIVGGTTTFEDLPAQDMPADV